MIGFEAWLLLQSGRDDIVGDLSRDRREDKDWPEGHNRSGLRAYLLAQRACEGAFEALEEAFREYEALARSHAKAARPAGVAGVEAGSPMTHLARSVPK